VPLNVTLPGTFDELETDKVMDVGLFTLAMAASEPMPVPLAFVPTTKFWALLTVSPKEPDEPVAAGV
jgi:hypothetical protein